MIFLFLVDKYSKILKIMSKKLTNKFKLIILDEYSWVKGNKIEHGIINFDINKNNSAH